MSTVCKELLSECGLQNDPDTDKLSIMEPVLDYLKRHLAVAGTRRFPAIAAEACVSRSLLFKIAGGFRDNPRIQTVQPLLDYFHEIDRGERELPPLITFDASKHNREAA
jgi:hypothetical protein